MGVFWELKPLRSIAAELALTIQRVHQLKTSALLRLQNALQEFEKEL